MEKKKVGLLVVAKLVTFSVLQRFSLFKTPTGVVLYFFWGLWVHENRQMGGFDCARNFEQMPGADISYNSAHGGVKNFKNLKNRNSWFLAN